MATSKTKFIYFIAFVVFGLSCCLHNVLAVPVEVPVQFVEQVVDVAPLSLLDLENTNESGVDLQADSEYQRSARGLGLLGGKFGGGFGGHGGLGLKGFGGLGGLGGFGGHGFGGGLGGFGGFKNLFGKKFF